jgi:hypothetical protein
MGADTPVLPIMIGAAASKNLMVLLKSVLADQTMIPRQGSPAADHIFFIFVRTILPRRASERP